MPDDGSVPLAEILRAVSAQLDALRAQASSLEDIMSPHLISGGGLSDEVIWEMQGLDWIRQGLEDLSTLADLLSDKARVDSLTGPEVAATIKALRLSSTKALLGSAFSEPHTQAAAATPSDVLLF